MLFVLIDGWSLTIGTPHNQHSRAGAGLIMLTADVAADIVASGIKVVILLVSVLVVPSLLVGLLVSVFQAVTQINEQTLSFCQG